MNDGSLTKNRAEALAAFIASIRAGWQAPGILAALAKARSRGTAAQVALAAIRAAADPANRTPAVIALDGRHWNPATDDSDTPTPVPDQIQEISCRRCGRLTPRGLDHRPADCTPRNPDVYAAGAAAAKAAIKPGPMPKEPTP